MVPAIVEKSRGLDRRDLEASDDVSLLGKRGCNSWLGLSRTRRELDRESRVGHGLHTREENARGPWTTSATRSVLDGLGTFFCFPLLASSRLNWPTASRSIRG